MARIVVSFELGQKVSSTLSILLIFLLSTIVALFTLHAAQEIIDLANVSPIFHIEKRAGGNAIDLAR